MRRTPTSRWAWVGSDATARWVVVFMMVCGAVATITQFTGNEQQNAVVIANAVTERNATAVRGLSLAEQVQQTCRANSIAAVELGSACESAEQVVADPIPGPTGRPGLRGVQGIPGLTGLRGEVGPRGPVGPPGAAIPGEDGADGSPGVDGKDGTDGTDGKDGTDGTDGAPGEPPAGWITTRADGSTETCTRAVDFNPATPRYTCTTAEAPPVEPTP